MRVLDFPVRNTESVRIQLHRTEDECFLTVEGAFANRNLDLDIMLNKEYAAQLIAALTAYVEGRPPEVV